MPRGLRRIESGNTDSTADDDIPSVTPEQLASIEDPAITAVRNPLSLSSFAVTHAYNFRYYAKHSFVSRNFKNQIRH